MAKRPSRPRSKTAPVKRALTAASARSKSRSSASDRPARIHRSSSGLPVAAASQRAHTGGSDARTDRRRVVPADGPSRLQIQGRGLRAKFMLLMSGVTAIALAGLGLVLAVTTDRFLFGQIRHQGIEVAKMAAQVGRAVLDSLPENSEVDLDEVEARVERYFNNARRWGAESPTTYSFIHGITFDGGPLSSMGVGEKPNRSATVTVGDTDFTIPGGKQVNLKQLPDIDAYPTYANIDGERLPVYRFKVNLNAAEGPGYSSMTVWVDVGIGTVRRVSVHLYLIIIGGILGIIALVLVAANTLAGRITKPLHLLMKDMRQVAKGDLDHRTKPHSYDEIGVLANEFNLMTHNLKIAQQAVIAQERAAYELSIAREVQQQLLPSHAPVIPGYEPAAFYRGAKEVSGDYYDFLPLGGSKLGFIVADVSGKGVPGSMLMAIMRTVIRLVAPKYGTGAAATLKETNRLIAREIKKGMFITAYYCVLDAATGEMSFASAGHNPMALYRHATKRVELQAPKGIAIGFNEGPLFDKALQEYQTTLTPGDAFVLYTDGFPEARDLEQRELGEEAFFNCIAESGHLGASQIINRVLQAVGQHRGKAAQSDDLTIIAVRRQLPGQATVAPRHLQQSGSADLSGFAGGT